MPNNKGKRRRFGAVRRLNSGRWQARFRDPASGELRSAPHTFDTKTDANVWLTGVEAEIHKGTFRDPNAGKITVGEWADRWFESASPHLKRRTVTLYAGLLRLWIKPRMGAHSLSAVRPIHIKEWLLGLQKAGLSPSRIRTAYRVLSQVFASAVDNELIAATPCRGIKLPRLPQTEPHVLSTTEVDQLLSHFRAPHDLLVKLLAYAGLRIGEAFALRRKDVDLAEGLIWVDEALAEVAGQVFFDTPKSHQKRPLRLPAFLLRELRDHLAVRVNEDQDALLFVGATGKPLRYNSWRRTHWDKAVEQAGLSDVTPQDLRATHASQVADRHGVMAAAKRLGHANASVTTRHYARSRDGQDAEIAKQLNADHDKAKRARVRKGRRGTNVARPNRKDE
jgi:integrase